MTIKQMAAGLLVMSFCTSAPALADDADVLKGYQKTGETEKCLDLSDIRTTRVLDGSHILFKMNGRRLYLNTLPHECSSLNFYKAFSYKVYGSTLCSSDTITVLTGGAVSGPTCGLGLFEEVEKVETSGNE
ncbi:MAG: hypothetical protein EP347_10800 [Alphaproteobacteria bacterium]|nr:MAG: hypothetical protein EP347_10800 [Alphaproteobacteria bacterium]